jgi:hypothetical protein
VVDILANDAVAMEATALHVKKSVIDAYGVVIIDALPPVIQGNVPHVRFQLKLPVHVGKQAILPRVGENQLHNHHDVSLLVVFLLFVGIVKRIFRLIGVILDPAPVS